MIRWLRGLGCALCISLLLPVAAGAEALPAADARAVRQVVQAQLDAFAADDAERAFSFASESIQAQFGDAATFMSMVLRGYPMVVRPAAVSFFLPEPEGANGRSAMAVRQAVQLRDRSGRLWLATYLLERQPDNAWRISGCVVRVDDGKSST